MKLTGATTLYPNNQWSIGAVHRRVNGLCRAKCYKSENLLDFRSIRN